ncbi:MAG TPA: cbb3-type cytochrome c oxidase subunit I [Acidimicrobiia bacterium]|nr:cbb3-type cytochrome c oxidase subunit I [Acidimicrobiia bacterium]
MTDTRTPDIRALLGGGTAEDRLAITHILVGAVLLLIGGALQLLSLATLRFGSLLPLPYGRLESASNLTLMIGFGAISLVGGVYYVLPRLTGTRLWGGGLAGLALLGMAGLTGLGVLAIFLGFGDGGQPLGLEWWLDLPIAAVLFVPALVTVNTLRRREEERSFVTVWFVLGGVVWLPLLYVVHLAADLPWASAVTVAYAESLFSAGFVTMFLVTVGSGLVYYTAVKELDVALASRQLALVGFWSLGFAGAWWGAAQLVFSPGPGWVAGVAAALGLAWPIGALANAANVSLTLEGSWSGLADRPGVLSGLLGLYLAFGVAIVAALAGFRSIGSVTSLTAFWEAVEYVSLTGVGALLVSSVSFASLPRMVGRELETKAKARRFQRFVIGGSVGLLISLGAAGILSGYSWIAGSNSAAYVDAGEGWAGGVGATYDTLTLIALLFGVILFLGVVGYVSIVFGTVARGRSMPQEILVTRDAYVETGDE